MKKTTRAKGDFLEDLVADLHQDGIVTIQKRVKVDPTISGEGSAEFDVLVTASVAGYQIRIPIECKNLKDKVGAEDISEFIGKVKHADIPIQQAVFVSASGYTEEAINRAHKRGVRPLTLEGLTADGLGLAVQQATHHVVFKTATVEQWTVISDSTAGNLMLWSENGRQFRFPFDIAYMMWRDHLLDDSIGLREIVLPIPYGWTGTEDGQPIRLFGMKAKIRFSAYLATIGGKAIGQLLRNIKTGLVEKGKAKVHLSIPNELSLTRHDSQEDLDSAISTGSFVTSLTARRVPRISIGGMYWPPSEKAFRALMYLREQGPVTILNLPDIEGTDLRVAFDPPIASYPEPHPDTSAY